MRHQYGYLDGLRGVAAVCVLFFHGQSWFPGMPHFANGYLAVDFFFALSGFVIAHAYEERLKQDGSLMPFLRDRVIRLHPLLVLGAILGAAAYLLKLHARHAPIGPLNLLTILAAIPPVPALWDQWLYPVNPPVWSIFCEVIVNIAFALTVRRLTTPVLGTVAGACAVLLTVFSLRHDGIIDAGPAALGWGAARVGAGFSLGILVLRLHRSGVLVTTRRRLWIPFTVVAIAVAPIPAAYVGWYDLSIALIVFPFLLLAAAGSAPVWPRLSLWSGALSYPLYCIHAPFLRVTEGIATRSGIEHSRWAPMVGLAIFGVIGLLSYLVHTYYDVPVRAWLRRRFGSRAHRGPPVVEATATGG